MVEIARDIYEVCDETDAKPKTRMLDWWCEEFKKKFGRDYFVEDYSKANGILKTLREKLGEEKLKEVCLEYFGSSDPFVVLNAHSLNTLPSQINKIIGGTHKPKEKTPAELLAEKHREKFRK